MYFQICPERYFCPDRCNVIYLFNCQLTELDEASNELFASDKGKRTEFNFWRNNSNQFNAKTQNNICLVNWMKTPFICALCNKSIPEIITSHSNGIKKWSQDIMPSESDGEDRCHRELPSSEEPQESFSTSDCEDPQSSDCEDPQSDPALFSFSFALDLLHTSMRESALLTSLERTWK